MPKLEEGIYMVPLRGRVKSTRELYDSIALTDPKARVVSIIDEDDPDYKELYDMTARRHDFYFAPPGWSTVEKINHLVNQFPGEKFYGLLANDIEVRTPGCLTALAAECPDFGLSYCDDSIQGHTLSTHPVVSGALVDALGWWAYPNAKHLGIDVYLMNIALDTGGCAYLPDHKFWHKHYTAMRSDIDKVYERAIGYAVYDRNASICWRDVDSAHYLKQVIRAMRNV